MTALRSALVWILITVSFVVMGIPFILASFFDPGGFKLYWFGRFYLRLCLVYIGVKLEVSGRENVPVDGSFMFMPNHRAWWDIPAVFLGIYPKQLRFVAKKELGNLPVFGMALKVAGHVLIDRGDRESAIRTLRNVGRKFSGRSSLVIFPEGTRSRGWWLLRFKRGGFHLARDLELPIVPVSIAGGDRIMRKGSLALHPGTMHVHFHAPIDPKDYATLDELIAAVRNTVAEGLKARGEYLDAPPEGVKP